MDEMLVYLDWIYNYDKILVQWLRLKYYVLQVLSSIFTQKFISSIMENL